MADPVVTEPILQFFAYDHLPPHLQVVSKPFCDLAMEIAGTIAREIPPERAGYFPLPDDPERGVAFLVGVHESFSSLVAAALWCVGLGIGTVVGVWLAPTGAKED